MAQIYYENDINRAALENRMLAVIGYYEAARALALNLRDSGFTVIVGLDTENARQQAADDDLEATTPAEAAQQADIIVLAVSAFYEAAAAGLTAGKTLLFNDAFAVNFGQIDLPADIDVALVAPQLPFAAIREEYEKGTGAPCLLAVEQDVSGKAKETALAYALGLGCARAGVVETTFREAAEIRLFGAQAGLGGGLQELLRAGFATLTEAGYAPEAAYFELVHQVKALGAQLATAGIEGINRIGCPRMAYGALTRGTRVVNETSRAAMREILEEIQNGSFAREWLCENLVKTPVLKKLRERDDESLLAQTGGALRKLMK